MVIATAQLLATARSLAMEVILTGEGHTGYGNTGYGGHILAIRVDLVKVISDKISENTDAVEFELWFGYFGKKKTFWPEFWN